MEFRLKSHNSSSLDNVSFEGDLLKVEVDFLSVSYNRPVYQN